MPRSLAILLTALVLTLVAGSLALAQDQPAQPGAPAPNVGISRNYWFEIILVILLCGGALWSVCRSSKRQ